MELAKSTLVSAVLLLCVFGSAESRPTYAARIPNGDSVPNPDGSGAICNGVGHTSCSGGGARNPFGQAFGAADLEWTVELCQADSDGDGLTNGQELGDPCCTWTEGSDAPLQTPAISHPGFAESKGELVEVNCDTAGNNTAPPPPQPTSAAAALWLRPWVAALVAATLLLLVRN
eukprot:jgi/Tetstr1/438630/TSEL_027181.t1